MPPKINHTTITPEEQARLDAKVILSSYGCVHSGMVIDYDEALEMLTDVLLNSRNK